MNFYHFIYDNNLTGCMNDSSTLLLRNQGLKVWSSRRNYIKTYIYLHFLIISFLDVVTSMFQVLENIVRPE